MHSLSKFSKRNPIKKADTSNSDNIAWDQLMAIADQLNPQVQQSFLNSVDALKTNIDSAGVAAALKHASPVEIADAILDLVMGGFDGLQSSLEQVIADAIMGVSNTKAFDIAVDVTPGAPSANQFINNYSLGRVQQITDEQKQLLQSKIRQGIDDGLNPVEVARQIRPYIGLTVNQANAVDNYRGMLETLDPQALTRKLRDSRFDNTIRNAISGNNPLVDDQIDYIVGRYAARALQHRAKTIGRTESMNALHQAQNYLWQQASDSGAVMASDLYRYWHVAHDERTCPICKPIPELNPEGVPLNGQFNTPVGPVDGPGMHPNCRCVVFTRPHISSLYNTNPSQLVDDLKSRDLYPGDDSEDIDTESDNAYKRLSKYNHNHDPDTGEFTGTEDNNPLNAQVLFSPGSHGKDYSEPVLGYHAAATDSPRTVFDSDGSGFNSNVFGSIPVKRNGIFFSNNPELASTYGKGLGKYKLNIKRTANADDENLIKEFVDSLDFHNPESRSDAMDANQIYLNMDRKKQWLLFDDTLGKRFVDFLKTKGYDSAAFQEDVDPDNSMLNGKPPQKELTGTTTVVFDPKDIEYIGPHKLKKFARISKFNHNHDPHSGEFASDDSQEFHLPAGGPDVEFTPKASLTRYIQSGNGAINGLLRGVSRHTLDGTEPNEIRALDNLFDNTPPLPKMTVYRGLTVNGVKRLTGNGELVDAIGTVVSDPAFISTSKDKEVAQDFSTNISADAHGMRGFMTISLPKGSNGVNVARTINSKSGWDATEKEILLPRGSKFRITAINVRTDPKFGDKVVHIKADWLGSERKPIPEKDSVVMLKSYTRGNGEFTTGGNSSPHMMPVEHYSPVANLDMLDPRKAGTGRAGRERKRKDRVDAVHVYDSKNAKLEQQFRHDYRYTGEIPTASIYDIAKDPDHLVPRSGVYDATKLELAIKNHGYMGFKNSASQNPSIIKLFYSLKVNPSSPRQYRGMRFGSPHSMNQRVVALKSWILHRISEKHLYLSAQ